MTKLDTSASPTKSAYARMMAQLTTDPNTGEPTGHLACPCSRYGRNGDACATWAVAYTFAFLVVGADDEAVILEDGMSKAVNDDRAVAQAIYEEWASIPDFMRRLLGGKRYVKSLLSLGA